MNTENETLPEIEIKATKSTEHDENLILTISKMMSSNIGSQDRIANILYNAISEVVEANVDDTYDIQDWCIALEALSRIGITIVERERAYLDNEE